uniref:G_PROTEIN_RECEP_F1_2 domain-containing protein n=1 Tax=Panagrellus redivivus TaxID=6233 RepID=A0A7E4ZYL9_PANRE
MPRDLTPYYLYIIEGSVIIFLSASLATVILVTPRFVKQKEYVLLAINVLFDAVFGLQYLLEGNYLLGVYTTYKDVIPMTTRWYCYTAVASQIMIILTPAIGLMAFANALDRLFMITYPGKYNKLGVSYPLLILCAVIICSLPTTIMAFIEVYAARDEEQPQTCLLQRTISPFLQYATRIIRIGATLAAVPLYIPILYKVRTVLRHSGAVGNTQKREIKLTLTIALITVNQVALFTVPDILVLVSSASFVYFVMNLNKGVINLFIILYCQRDIRHHIFTCGKARSRLTSRTTAVGQKTETKAGSGLPVS